MENPNIHNIPYARSRDQKRWNGHSKKISSRQETTERMRKWRAENKDKNKRNDLRCRVYRLARQKFGEEDSEEKQQFIQDEINRRLGRSMLLEQQKQQEAKQQQTYPILPSIATLDEKKQKLNELPFYCAPLHKIELPSISVPNRRLSQSTEPAVYVSKSQPNSPLSEHSFMDTNDRRQSACSINSSFSSGSNNNMTMKSPIFLDTPELIANNSTTCSHLLDNTILPPMQVLTTSNTHDRSYLLCPQPPN